MNLSSDVTASGQHLRVLSVVDSFTRECLAFEVETRLVIPERGGVPVRIRL